MRAIVVSYIIFLQNNYYSYMFLYTVHLSKFSFLWIINEWMFFPGINRYVRKYVILNGLPVLSGVLNIIEVSASDAGLCCASVVNIKLWSGGQRKKRKHRLIRYFWFVCTNELVLRGLSYGFSKGYVTRRLWHKMS